MRTALAGLTAAVALSAVSLTACAAVEAGKENVACRAAEHWLDADPADRKAAADDLSDAVDDLENSLNDVANTPRVRRVIDAAKDLLSGNAKRIDEGAAKIRKYC